MKSILILLALLSIHIGHCNKLEDVRVGDYKDFNSEDLLKWEAPEEFVKAYPYFLSGFGYEDTPVWVAEYGKYDPTRYVKGGPEVRRDMKLYFLQMFARFLQSAEAAVTEDGNAGEFVLICDMEGLQMRHIASPIVIELALWIARQAEMSVARSWKAIHIINANYVFTTIWNLVRPLIGQSVYKVNIYGSNKQAWMPKLLREIPREQIPTWLGGSDSHKPLKIYG